MKTKICKGQFGCGEEFPISKFRVRRQHVTGKRGSYEKTYTAGMCIDCERDYGRSRKALVSDTISVTEPVPEFIHVPWRGTGPRIITGMGGA